MICKDCKKKYEDINKLKKYLDNHDSSVSSSDLFRCNFCGAIYEDCREYYEETYGVYDFERYCER